MRYLVLILGIIVSLSFNNKIVNASSFDLSSSISGEENDIYVVPVIKDLYSFYEARAFVKFSGTATHQIDVISPEFSMPGVTAISFDYESPQKYDVGFSYDIQRYSATTGWVDVMGENLVAKSSIKNYTTAYAFSNQTGPFRLVIRTDDARGVKITNGKVTY